MRLRTEMLSAEPGEALLVYDADCGLSPERQAEHDAMAAHALLQAIREFVDPVPIERRAAEILAGWLEEE